MINLNKPRKIINYNYSFLITLPREWLKHHNLCKGDGVKILTDAEGNLVLKPNKEMKNDRDATAAGGTGEEVPKGDSGI